MAKELLSPKLTADVTYYSLIFSSAGQVFNGTVFENYVDANYATYVVAMTELGTSSGIYAADLPGALSAATRYSYMVMRQVGGSPAISDTLEAQGVLGPEIQLSDVWKRLGLDGANPLINTDTAITAGAGVQIAVTKTSTQTTLTRQ